jgi:hypothetical protein
MKSKIIIVVLVCVYLSSCALIFKGTKEEVRANSDPTRAQVWVNGINMGETPITMKLESKKPYTFEFKKEGYKSKTILINNHVGAGYIILDILCGLVPIIIDAATGAWYSLDQKSIDMILEKQQPHPVPIN